MRLELIKKEGASESVLTVMIWAIFSLLLVRIYLQMTGYPQIGHGSWHVSHALFGGLIMVVGAIMNMTLEGKKIKKISEVILGFGLGWFIDEVGKYLTKDYNYFFRPAIIVIYISFIGLFLFYRYLESVQAKSNAAKFYAVLNKLEEVINDDLEIKEKRYLQKKLLEISSTTDNYHMRTLALGISEAVGKIEPVIDRNKSGLPVLFKKLFKISYDRVFGRKVVMYGLWIYSVFYAGDKIIDILRITASSQKMMMIQRFYEDYNFFGRSDIYMIVFKMVFDMAAAILFLIGARYFWSKKRNRGIRCFRYGLYVSIFFVSIFRFYFEQFAAIYELVISVMLLELLNQYQRDMAVK